MGCGGSKPEVVQETRPTATTRPPSAPRKSDTQQSNTDSSLGPQSLAPRPIPIGVPVAVPTAAAAAAPAVAGLGPQPLIPNGRVNSANRPSTLQYASPRGNLPVQRVQDIVDRAPAPGAPLLGPIKRGMYYPKTYGNREGPRDNPTPNFAQWEIQQGDDPANDRNMKMHEYPVKPLRQPPPFASEYNFQEPSCSLRQTEPAKPNDRQAYEKRWGKPPNDPGPLRAVINKDGHVVGAMYHPEGEKGRYERSRLEPLDSQGRGQLARYSDRKLSGRTTWPERGPGGEMQARVENTVKKGEEVGRASKKSNKTMQKGSVERRIRV